MLDWRTLYWWFPVVGFGCYMVYQISIDPITWDSLVTIILFLIITLPPFIFWLCKWYRKRTLFRPEYQPYQDVSVFTHETEASNEVKYVQTTLRMALECNVEFIGIVFEGEGTLPIIENLDDWQWGLNEVPKWVSAYHLQKEKDPQGRWFWYYLTPHHRLKGTRITIGIAYLAADFFDGYLVFGVNCKEGSKRQKLPFTVIKRSS